MPSCADATPGAGFACRRECRPRCLVVVILSLSMLATGAAAQSQDASLYKEALTREAALRDDLAALDAAGSPEPLYARVRVMIGAYEDLALLFPESEYGDDALWHGGVLAADLFGRSGDAGDRGEALRLFEALAERFPESPLTPKASPLAARLRQPSADPRPAVTRAASPRPAAAAPPPAAAAAASSAPARPTAILRTVRHELRPEVVRITLAVEREVSFTDQRVVDPPRVFVDLHGVAPSAAVRDATFALGDPIVKRLRVVAQPDGRTRIAVDLVAPADYSVYALYNPFRLVIDFERRQAGSTAAAGAATARAAVRTGSRAAAAPVVAAPRPPASNAGGGFSLSRQLGLGAARIVIDPGHGGHDPGAEVAGLTEAGLVLDVALRLERLLKAGNHADVVLTRRDDTFVALEDRTAIANRGEADLFLSIHANANAAPGVRGVETYVLNFASTAEAEALAARENAASSRRMRDLPDLVRTIADDNKLDESRDFARLVQRTLYERLRTVNKGLKNLGVKQAPFMVLVGARMPAILAEIAFMTNRQEAVLLRTAKYRQQIAEALLAGITGYQETLKKAVAAGTW